MSHFIIDEGFDYFLEKFEQPDWQKSVDQATLNYYQGKLPNRLLFYWQQFGFCRFKQGLFWIVNPADYEDELALWLGEPPRDCRRLNILREYDNEKTNLHSRD